MDRRDHSGRFISAWLMSWTGATIPVGTCAPRPHLGGMGARKGGVRPRGARGGDGDGVCEPLNRPWAYRLHRVARLSSRATPEGVCGRARGDTRCQNGGRSGPPRGGPSRRGRAIRAGPRRGARFAAQPGGRRSGAALGPGAAWRPGPRGVTHWHASGTRWYG